MGFFDLGPSCKNKVPCDRLCEELFYITVGILGLEFCQPQKRRHRRATECIYMY